MVYNYIAYFLLYSFIGWIYEVLIVFAVQKKLVNRGFLHGPVCPIYGVAILTLVIALQNFHYSILLIFLFGSLIVSFVELSTGLIMQKLFHSRWWDYSHFRFNFRGYISLEISIIWGLFSIFVIYGLQPAIVHMVYIIPKYILQPLVTVVSIIFIIDTVSTIIQMFAFKKLLQRASSLEEDIVLRVEYLHKDFQRWIKAHPRLQSIRFKKQIEELKGTIKLRK